MSRYSKEVREALILAGFKYHRSSQTWQLGTYVVSEQLLTALKLHHVDQLLAAVKHNQTHVRFGPTFELPLRPLTPDEQARQAQDDRSDEPPKFRTNETEKDSE